MAIKEIKSKVDQVSDEVNATATTTISEISKNYSAACLGFTNMFLEMINTAIDMLTRIMNLMDDLKKEIDNDYEKQPSFPPFPPFPEFPDTTWPTFDTDELACPIAQCLGFPKIPSFKFPSGLPEGADFDVIEQFKEYTGALAGMGSAYGNILGKTIKVQSSNALKLLERLPQAGLNLLADSMMAVIAETADTFFFEEVDGMIECLVTTDPAFATTEEIVRYKALRKRYNIAAGAAPTLDIMELSKGPLEQLEAFKGQKDVLLARAEQANVLINDPTSVLPTIPSLPKLPKSSDLTDLF